MSDEKEKPEKCPYCGAEEAGFYKQKDNRYREGWRWACQVCDR